MPISDHYRGGMTERLIVSVVTVDPPTGRVEVVGKDAAVIQIKVQPIPVVFRWPREGEYWTIVRENGVWALDALVESLDSSTRINNIQPGEALIQSETLLTPSGERFRTTADKNVQLPSYTVANKPSATSVPGGTVIFVSDGAPGSVVQVSNGTTWVNLG